VTGLSVVALRVYCGGLNHLVEAFTVSDGAFPVRALFRLSSFKAQMEQMHEIAKKQLRLKIAKPSEPAAFRSG